MILNNKHIALIIIFASLGCNLLAQFVVMPNNSITIKEGSSLYIGTNLSLESTSSGSGYLADQTADGDVTITGNIIVQRYISANGWHNVSMPVTSANSSLFSGSDLVFYYDETKIYNDWNFGWVWYEGDLSTMKGYDVYLDANAITVNYTAANSSGLNTGAYNIGVTLTNVTNGETDNHKGWNLIGNPYPSPLDWLEEGGWNKSNINDAKYIWNPDADNYTIFLGGASPVGINGGTQFIPSNQGFWVQAIANGIVSVNNSARKGVISSTPDYYKNTEYSYPIISLKVNGNSLSDETIIRFISSTTSNFDLNYDATKLYGRSQMLPQISTSSDDLDFSINTLPTVIDGMEIPLNFSCETAGNYCLELSENSNLNSINSVYLFDKFDKTIVDLTFQKHYCFEHLPYNIRQRFLIIINPSDNKLSSLKINSPFLVYSYGKTISITNLATENIKTEVDVYNLLGQRVISKSFNERNINFNLDVKSGYYIVRIISENGQFNSKIILQ